MSSQWQPDGRTAARRSGGSQTVGRRRRGGGGKHSMSPRTLYGIPRVQSIGVLVCWRDAKRNPHFVRVSHSIARSAAIVYLTAFDLTAVAGAVAATGGVAVAAVAMAVAAVAMAATALVAATIVARSSSAPAPRRAGRITGGVNAAQSSTSFLTRCFRLATGRKNPSTAPHFARSSSRV